MLGWFLFHDTLHYHNVRAEGNKLDDTSKGKFANVVCANIDMSGVLPEDWISRHDDIAKDIGTTLLSETEILKDSTDVHDLLASFTS